MNIFKLKPAYKDYLWGGNNLRHLFNYKSEAAIIAEAWVLSTHREGQSMIDSGQTLKEVINQESPILIKFIDAKDSLSIQVHPNNEYALKNENEVGKSELWHIVDCEKDAYIYLGFNQDITKEAVKQHIKNNTLTNVLNKITVNKGDTFYVEAGTIHAIGSGCLILEVQQSSDSTYRVYDFNRTDNQGKPRELHIEKALDVLNLNEAVNDNIIINNEKEINYTSPYFTFEKYNVKSEKTLDTNTEQFSSLIILKGQGQLRTLAKTLEFTQGDCLFIKKDIQAIKLLGNCEAVLVKV